MEIHQILGIMRIKDIYKRLFIILAFLGLLIIQLYPQNDSIENQNENKPNAFNFGFTIGLNYMDFSIEMANPINVNDFVYTDLNTIPGFQLNFISQYSIMENLDIRFLPGISLGARTFIFTDENGKVVPLNSIPDYGFRSDDMTLQSSFVELPFNLKYGLNRNNKCIMYIIGGLCYRIDMSAQGDFNPEMDQVFLVKRNDLYVEFGLGLENHLQNSIFSPELKFAIGLFNVMETSLPGAEYFAESILDLRSFIIMLNFHIE